MADIDRDGDMDALVVRNGAENQLLANQTAGSNRDYIMVRLSGNGRDALGATVDVTDCSGNRVGVGPHSLGARAGNGGGGHGSQDSPLLHFGLGASGAAQIYRLTATFPGGVQRQIALRPDQFAGYQLVNLDLQEASDVSVCGGSPLDTDGDGVADVYDVDDDNDGIPDEFEGGGDFDGDGVPNRLDLDSDNDTLPDIEESGLPHRGAGSFVELDVDRDGRIDPKFPRGANGMADIVESQPGSGVPDYDNNGTVDLPRDTDNDGAPDFKDVDSDNDGVGDIVESGGEDGNGDGIVDNFQDSNGDGWHDPAAGQRPDAEEGDSNGDGLPDHLDPNTVGDGGKQGSTGNGTEVDTGVAGVGAWQVSLAGLFGLAWVRRQRKRLVDTRVAPSNGQTQG